MALITQKAVALSLVDPLGPAERRKEKEVGQKGLKRFTSICSAGKMV